MPEADDILYLKEVAKALRLDPRTVKRIACELGGKHIGRCWRFRWGTVMEYFSNAYVEKRPKQCLVGQSRSEWEGSEQQILPSRAQKGSRVDGGKTMGDRSKKRIPPGTGKKEDDPHGLRASLGLG